MEKLPFMATENIMMRAVKKGGNRQELHEKLRTYSHASTRKVKMEGGTHNLIEKILADKDFHLTVEEFVQQIAEPVYTKLDTEIQCQLKI